MQSIIDFLSNAWKPTVEVIFFWYGFFMLLKFLRSTGALHVLKGLFLIFVVFVVVQFFGLTTISRLMREILPISVIAFVVVFQDEIRKGLGRIGQSSIFKMLLKEEKIIDELIRAIAVLSERRIGAIIAFERQVSLKKYSETGVSIDGSLSFELISTIFMPNSPLHDGGVVINALRVSYAGCLFPLSASQRISKSLGTRHRAALGLTEETDAVAIVVSEETGIISIAEKGEFTRDLNEDNLREFLKYLYVAAPKSSEKESSSYQVSHAENKE